MSSESTGESNAEVGSSSWLSVILVAIVAFSINVTEWLPVGMLSQMSKSLEITETICGWSVTIPAVVAAFAGMLSILLAKNMDRRSILIAITAMLAISNYIACFAPSFSLLLVGRFVLGLALGSFWTFAHAAGRNLVTKESGNRANSIIFAGLFLGTILGLPVGSFIGDRFGWRMAFLGNASLATALLVAQLIVLPSIPKPQVFSSRSLLDVFRIPGVRIAAAVTLFTFIANYMAYTYMEPFLRRIPDIGAGTVSVVLFLYAAVGFVGNFVGEAAIGKIGASKTYLGVVAGLGLFLLLLGILELPPILTIVELSVWGFFWGAVPVCLTVLTAESAKDQMEPAFAILVASIQISIAIGSFLGGQVVSVSSIPTTFAIAGGLVFVSAFILLNPFTKRI